MRKKILLLAGVWTVCAVGAVRATEMEIPLEGSGWSVWVDSDVFSYIGVTVFGLRPATHSVLLELDKEFTECKDDLDAPFQPITFRFVKTDGATTYSRFVIRDEFVVNGTNCDWHDFHMTLGPDDAAGFDDSVMPDGDKLPNVSYTNYTGYNGYPVRLNFEGGIVPHDAPLNRFRPGYQSGDIIILTNPALAAGGEFTLQEQPTPEPGSILLLFGLSWFALKKNRS